MRRSIVDGMSRMSNGLGSLTGKRAEKRARFAREIKTSSLPSHVISLSVWAEPQSDAKHLNVWDCRLKRWAIVHRQRRSGRDPVLTRFDGTTAVEFWMSIGKIVREHTKPWIITPDANGSFRMLDGWELSDSGLIGWGSLVDAERERNERKLNGVTYSPCQMILSDSITVLSHEFAPGRLTWVSIGNYLPCDIPSFARSVGIDYESSMDYGPGGASFQFDCQSAAEIIDRYFDKLMTSYLDDGGGHWRTTAAQLSHQTWRKSYCKTPILETADPRLYELERDGIYGGRQEAYFLGTVGAEPGSVPGEQAGPSPECDAVIDGPLYQYDVRSQYPAILATRPFPVAFSRWESGISISGLESVCRDRGAIARVEINTPEADYPVKLAGNYVAETVCGQNRFRKDVKKARERTVFPVGTFTTTLYAPELLHAIERDRVIRVLAVATYRTGYPFRDYAKSMIELRGQARENGDSTREDLLKLLANSFAGKWASRSGGWKTVRGKIAPERWGEWYEVDVASGVNEAWRSISGISQKYEPRDDTPQGCPYVFGYLTSYGRIQLLEIIRAAGPRGCVWCHTDGIVLTKSGKERVEKAGLIGNGEPGRLRFVGEVDRCRIWGPSHYFCNGEWTLAGFTASSWIDGRGNVLDWRRPTVRDLIANKGRDALPLSLQSASLSSSRSNGTIDPEGWSLPVEVSNGVPLRSSLPDEY